MSEAPTTSPDTGGEADGWIEWTGGENPAAAREVFIKMRGYGAPSPTELRADLLDWHWRSSHRGADIIAYRLATPTPRKAEGVWERVDLRNQVAHIIVQKVLQEDYDDLVEGYLDEILAAADQIILLPAYKAVAKGYYDRLAAAPTAEVK